MLEAVVENLSVLDEGILGFDLPEDTSDDRAREIETFLNENITNAHFTYFPPRKKAWPMSNVVELSRPHGFTNADMALLFRVLAELRRVHPAAVLETGCVDEGDPWANIEADEDGDIVISATRVDGKWAWMDAQGKPMVATLVTAQDVSSPKL
jgi:hypothetical protein